MSRGKSDNLALAAFKALVDCAVETGNDLLRDGDRKDELGSVSLADDIIPMRLVFRRFVNEISQFPVVRSHASTPRSTIRRGENGLTSIKVKSPSRLPQTVFPKHNSVLSTIPARRVSSLPPVVGDTQTFVIVP